MADFFSSIKLSKLFLYFTLTSFSVTCVHSPAYGQIFDGGPSLKDAALIIRLEKIIEKLMKLEKKGNTNEMIDLMLDAKAEVENATGQVIQINPQLDRLYIDISKKGYKIPIKQFNNLKNKIKSREKRSQFHAEYIAMVLDNPESSINLDDEEILFSAKHGHDKEDQKEENSIELPARVTFGITVALCGVFLYCLPIPQAKTWGFRLIEAGVALAVEGGFQKIDKDEEEKKR